MMPSELILAVSHLKVSYDSIQAVDDISFDVGKGEIVTLIGGNHFTRQGTAAPAVWPNDGIVALRRLPQRLNAALPIEVTLLGIGALANFVQT